MPVIISLHFIKWAPETGYISTSPHLNGFVDSRKNSVWISGPCSLKLDISSEFKHNDNHSSYWNWDRILISQKNNKKTSKSFNSLYSFHYQPGIFKIKSFSFAARSEQPGNLWPVKRTMGRHIPDLKLIKLSTSATNCCLRECANSYTFIGMGNQIGI